MPFEPLPLTPLPGSRIRSAFRRRYVDGIEPAPSVSMFVGKVVHGVLEHVYRNRTVGTICTEADLPAFVEAAWSRSMEMEPCFWDDEAHEQKCRNQVHDLAATYLRETDIEAEMPLAVEKRYEVNLVDPLTGEDLGIPLVGIVDLILDTKDGPVVVDFKTAASASSNCQIQHELQLSAYSYLIRSLLGRNESALEIRQLIKTKTPKIVVHRFAAASSPVCSGRFSARTNIFSTPDLRPGFSLPCPRIGPDTGPRRK